MMRDFLGHELKIGDELIVASECGILYKAVCEGVSEQSSRLGRILVSTPITPNKVGKVITAVKKESVVGVDNGNRPF